MMILTRYLLRNLFVSTVFVTVVLTGVIWLTQSLRLVDVFINRGVGVLTFFKLVLLLLPDLVGIILPVGLLIAVLFVFSRMFADNELIILRSNGMSDLGLIKPAFILATAVCGLLYAINLYFLPVAFSHFRDAEHQIRNSINLAIMQPGEFNTFRKLMVYVRANGKNGELGGVLIHDLRTPGKICNITAEFGKIVETENGTRLVLVNGSRQERSMSGNAPSILSFDQYLIDLGNSQTVQAERQRKPHERFISDLFDPADAGSDLNLRRKLRVEAHQRLLTPFTSIAFVLISLWLFLTGDYNRRGRSKKISMVVSICIFLEVLLLILLNLGEKFPVAIVASYGIIVCAILIPTGFFVVGSRNSDLQFMGRE